jgi:DNA-binding transcriptional MerR regulator
MAAVESLRAKAVKEICGFGSVAMLDYLERSGVFKSQLRRRKHKGRPREYTFRDVLVLKTIATLLENGASVAAIKDALEKLQAYKWKADPAVLEHSPGSIRHLIFSAGRFYFPKDRDELVDLAFDGQLTFAFILDLDRLHSIVQSEWGQTRIKLSA